MVLIFNLSLLQAVPKIDKLQPIDGQDFEKFIKDKIEIQLLNDNFMTSLENTKTIISRLPSLEYVVLHLPEKYVDVGLLCSDRKLEAQFVKLIVECIKMTQGTNLYIDILFHGRMNYTSFKMVGGLSFLDYITSLVDNTNVGFLIENSIHDACIRNTDADVTKCILENFDNPKLSMCLDLCHLQASENMMECDISLSQEVVKRIKNIHFSMTLDNDGYKNKPKTHGRVHDCFESFQKDIDYLVKKGLDVEKINFVTEINEDDYKHRPDMYKELMYFANPEDVVEIEEFHKGKCFNKPL